MCDHAAWFAGRAEQHIWLFNAPEATAAAAPDGAIKADAGPDEILRYAAGHLNDLGATAARRVVGEQDFAACAPWLARTSDVLVLGKRGDESRGDKAALGRHVERFVCATTGPVCLVSQYFLPIDRMLVLLDADPEHQRTGNLVANHRALDHLSTHVLVVNGDGNEEKQGWARKILRHLNPRVRASSTATASEATDNFLQRDGADLIVLSRELAIADGAMRLLETQSFWSRRTPVLIC